MNEQEKGTSNVMMSSSEGYNIASALQIRLDTDPILQRLEMHLRGFRESIEVNEGQPQIVIKEDGEPLMNDAGIQAILGKLRSIINPQVVQGNFKEEDYGDYLCRHRKAIATDLMNNMNRYGLKEDNYLGVMDLIFSVLEPFISRLRDNKERESYAATIRSVESNTSQLRSKGGLGGMSPFPMKGGA